MCSPPAASARPTTTSPPTRRQGVRRADRCRPRARGDSSSARAPACELNEARLRMARIPEGADLIDNKISTAPGFRIGNVHRHGRRAVDHAGDARRGVAPQLETGAKMLSEIRARRRARGRHRHAARRDREGQSGRDRSAAIRSSTATGPNTNIVVRSRDAEKLAAVKARRSMHDAERLLHADA